MKKKIKIIFTLFLLFQSGIMFSQKIVYDPINHQTIRNNHERENDKLEDIKEREGLIAGAQAVVATKLEELRKIEKKFEEAMVTVDFIVNGIYLGMEIYQTTVGVTELTSDLVQDVIDDPKLMAFVVPIVEGVTAKVTQLGVHVTTVTVGGVAGVVWMMPADRIKVLENVAFELRQIRNMLLSARHKMIFAKRYGFLRVWNPMLMRKLNGLRKKRRLQDFFNRSGHGRGLNFY